MDFDDQPEGSEAAGEDGQHGATHEEEFLFGIEGEEGPDPTQQRDAVIFVVDCSRSMLTPQPNGKSNVAEILAAACSFMKTKIITSDSDRLSIVLYSCKATQNILDLPGVFVYRNLDFPDAQTITSVDKLSKSPETFESTYCQWPAGQNGLEASLCDVLSVCHNLMQGIEKLNCSRRIFLFTDNDDPNADNKHNQQRAIQRAHDLYEQNVNIELFPMPKPDQGRFEVGTFYADLISVDADQLTALMTQDASATRFQELAKRIRQKEFRKRTLGKCVFRLSPKTELAVKLYSMVQEVNKPHAKNLDAKTNKPLKTITRWICEDTGSVLYGNQIGTYFPYGGEKVLISKEEMKTIKKFDTPGIKLMGFKPRSSLKDYMNIRSSYFLTADDSSIVGSGQLLDALIKQMIVKEKVAIARVIPREASIVRFCALLPQTESVDPEDNFPKPAGFHMVFLPFSDDIRSPESVVPAQPAESPSVNEEQLRAAKLLVKNLTINFDSRQFENPAIQKFYAATQALALGEEQVEEVKDIMQPDYEGMSKFAEILDQFKTQTFGPDYNFSGAGNGNGNGKGRGRGKRGANALQSKGAPAKRKKNKQENNGEEQSEEGLTPKARKHSGGELEDPRDEYDLQDDDAELKDRFNSGAISSLSVAELKDKLKERKIKIGKGNKDYLLAELRKYLQI